MKSKIICIAFILLVFAFTIFDFITPDREFSEWENRELAELPKADFKAIANGDFGRAYEEYMTDQFVMRDLFVKLKASGDGILGKKDSGGVYLTDEALYSVQTNPDYSIIDKNLGAIEAFSERTGISSYLLTVPSSTYIYRDKLPAFAPYIDEKEIFSYVGKNITGAKFIDTANSFEENAEHYNYFRTDHHWTSDGALIGYNSFLSAQGMEMLTKDEFVISEVSREFVGTLSSKAGKIPEELDVLEKWHRGEVESVEIYNGVESTTYESIYFDEYLDKKDKYSYYLGTNQPIVKVTTSSNGGRLLVFKDSYAHIMTPLMLGDWSEIVLVDLRYVKGKLDGLLKTVTGEEVTDFDTALFLYSCDTFTTQDNMIWIK